MQTTETRGSGKSPGLSDLLIDMNTARCLPLEQRKHLDTAANNAKQDVLCGLQGIGAVLGCAGSAGEVLNERQVAKVGWMITELADVLLAVDHLQSWLDVPREGA